MISDEQIEAEFLRLSANARAWATDRATFTRRVPELAKLATAAPVKITWFGSLPEMIEASKRDCDSAVVPSYFPGRLFAYWASDVSFAHRLGEDGFEHLPSSLAYLREPTRPS